MLPTHGMIDTIVWFFVSSSCTTSPVWRAAYCCAPAGREVAIETKTASPRVRVANIFVIIISCYSGSAKLKTVFPAASATYCRPSIA